MNPNIGPNAGHQKLTDVNGFYSPEKKNFEAPYSHSGVKPRRSRFESHNTQTP